MNIALPVQKGIQHPLGWAHIASLEGAAYSHTKTMYQTLLPQKMENCPKEGLSETASMPVSAFIGTAMISAIPFVLGLCFAVAEKWYVKRFQNFDSVVAMDDGDRIDKLRLDIHTMMKQLSSLQEAQSGTRSPVTVTTTGEPPKHPHVLQ
mmetsp:Transcript_43193/g.100085  ORF Transcript_43193/g.100085 Transcript_43193/m.100085 type:complete len:150 (+) Transcript_43193:1884-2333(+)